MGLDRAQRFAGEIGQQTHKMACTFCPRHSRDCLSCQRWLKMGYRNCALLSDMVDGCILQVKNGPLFLGIGNFEHIVSAIGSGEQKILVALAGQWRRRSSYAK